MDNQNNTQSKDTNVKFDTSEAISLQKMHRFYNFMHEDEPLNESSFLRAWDVFNEMEKQLT